MKRGAIAYQAADEKFSRVLKARAVLNGLTLEGLGKRAGECKSTTVHKVNNPAKLTVEELRSYTKALELAPDEVLLLIYGKNPAE